MEVLTKKVITFRKGSPKFNVDPEIAHNEIIRIKELYGGVATVEQIYQEAINPDNPLHQAIDWDPDSAIRKQALQTIRMILNCIVIQEIPIDMVDLPLSYKPSEDNMPNSEIVFTDEEPEDSVPAFVGLRPTNDEDSNRKDYRDRDSVLKSKELTLKHLKETHNILMSYMKKFALISLSLDDVIYQSKVDEALDQLIKIDPAYYLNK